MLSPRRPAPRTDAHAPRFGRPPNPFQVPDAAAILALRRDRRRPPPPALTAARRAHCTYRHSYAVDCAPASAEEAALACLIAAPDCDPPPAGLRRFISLERELFEAQLAIDRKREEIHRLARLEDEEAQNLRAKEAEVAHFQEQFRAFIDEDDRRTLGVLVAADEKAKERARVAALIKRVSTQNSILRNAISACEEKLELWEQYRLFLEGLTPPEWPPSEMYFKSPDQLLSMMAWLEAQNMSLMQHCQDAEHLVERYFTRFEQMLRARDGAISEKQEELKRRKAAFRESQGITEGFHWGNELSEAELRELQAAISKFDIELGFDSTKSIDTVTMLTRIENVMEKLRLRLAKLDPRLLQEKLQRKAFERKDEESAARILLEQREQDEKAQRTIQQAMMGIKEKTGRPVVHRMLPIFMPDRELSDLEYRRKQERAAADADLLYGDLWD